MAQSRHQDHQLTDRLARWVHERTRIGVLAARLRGRVFPDRWSSMFGQVTVFSFVVVTLTGVLLMFFYDPSTEQVRYDGSHALLRGVEMSRALESTLDISFEVRGGLLVRQLHHWSASVMIASLMLHILWVFFTGAFRKPRDLRWVLLFLVLFASLAAGLTGAVLPDDLMSGTSLAVLNGVLRSTPVLGSWLSSLVFQGDFPSGAIATFYPLHVVILPVAIVVLLSVVGVLAAVHKPAQFPGPGKTEHNVVGRPLRVAATKSAGFFFVVCGFLTVMAATAQVNPIWVYGPADPASAPAGAGPLWYLAFLDGAQRLVPPGWEFVWLDRTWTPALLVPVGVCTLYLLAAMLYPFLEAWVTGDRRQHHLLNRPRNTPTRTAIGVAGIVFYGVLWAAGGSDDIALQLSLSVNGVVLFLQFALVLGPPLAFAITKRICLGLQRKDREIVLYGRETGQIIRLPGGGYVEQHQPIDERARWRLLNDETAQPMIARRDGTGRIRRSATVRMRLSRWFSEDRVRPLTRDEVEREHAIAAIGSGDPDRAGVDVEATAARARSTTGTPEQ